MAGLLYCHGDKIDEIPNAPHSSGFRCHAQRRRDWARLFLQFCRNSKIQINSRHGWPLNRFRLCWLPENPGRRVIVRSGIFVRRREEHVSRA
jgi:hypothetical protein